jgi:3-oxoacyl-[acyl-carrier protein] reductase
MFKSLEGRSVIVTGSSKGIGRAIARRFASVGCRLLIVSRHLADARVVAEEIRAAGGAALPFAADVAQASDTAAMAAAALAAYGTIDIVCVNAGIFPTAMLSTMTPVDFDTVIDTNLKGTFLTVSACLQALKARGAGRIILTSSITGPITGFPGWSHYGASKAGQLGFMRTAAIELAAHGITVNAVLPGNIATEGLADMGADYERSMAASVPMRRLGTVDDVANAVLYFASDEAAYVTGQSLVIDGGQILPESLAAVSSA